MVSLKLRSLPPVVNKKVVIKKGVVLYIHDMSKKIYIIDGHSHLYASFYAIRRLSSPSGEPTNATYGMTSVILKILRDHKPDYLLTVFDPPGKTYRDTLLPNTRPTALPCRTIWSSRSGESRKSWHDGGARRDYSGLRGRRHHRLCYPRRPEGGDGGRHLLQGQRPGATPRPEVRLYDSTKEKFTDPATLKADKGLTPEQVIDYLALMGDAVDNVPGIPGVGPKTAQKLIQEFGTIDNMLDEQEKLPQKIKEYLADPQNVEKLMLSRRSSLPFSTKYRWNSSRTPGPRKFPTSRPWSRSSPNWALPEFIQNLGLNARPLRRRRPGNRGFSAKTEGDPVRTNQIAGSVKGTGRRVGQKRIPLRRYRNHRDRSDGLRSGGPVLRRRTRPPAGICR